MLAGALAGHEPFRKEPGYKGDTRQDEWEKKSKFKGALLFPLQFTMTPLSSYSISMFQVQILGSSAAIPTRSRYTSAQVVTYNDRHHLPEDPFEYEVH